MYIHIIFLTLHLRDYTKFIVIVVADIFYISFICKSRKVFALSFISTSIIMLSMGSFGWENIIILLIILKLVISKLVISPSDSD